MFQYYVSCKISAMLLMYLLQFRQKVIEALNKQTDVQFKAYAEQQFPGNKEQVIFFIDTY